MSEKLQETVGSIEHRLSPKSLRWWGSRFRNVLLFLCAGVLLIVLLGVAQRTGWIRGSSGPATASSSDAQQQIYFCSMDPQIRQIGPGRCPICGMELVPLTDDQVDLDRIGVTIAPAQRRLANIQTADVTKQPVTTTIGTIGVVQMDESRQAIIAAYINGRVERVFADYTGVMVEKSDHLAVVYSPQLYSAQVEYLEAKNTLAKSNVATLAVVRDAQAKLVANSRQRLVELGMTEQQLAELDASNEAKSRLTIYAPIGGTVVEKLAEEGQYIMAGEPIYRIANLSTVWLMLELYPEDASQIRFGQVVRAELTSLPGKELTGRVAFIDPTVNDSNRTVGVRVEFKNDDGELRPGDYAQATIEIPIGPQGEVYDAELAGKWISPMHPQIIRDEPGDCPICGMNLVPTSRYGYTDQPVAHAQSITIPRSALLMAGEHSVVYVETEPGRFELRTVSLGPILADQVVILDGLEPGERVATSGNFLIDSQMQLAGKPSLIDPTRHVAKQDNPNAPLELKGIHVTQLEGAAGEHLEHLFQAYFEIQQALANDSVPSEQSVLAVDRGAANLLAESKLPEKVQKELKIIQDNIPHLHHLAIDEVRVKFKALSHAAIRLAAQVRGEKAEVAFHHFFCPMVKNGNGDWLQPDKMLSNPYYGSEMLRCGELVRTIPTSDPSSVVPEDDHTEQKHPATEERLEGDR